MPVITGAAVYPHAVLDNLSAKGVSIDEVEALDLALAAGTVKAKPALVVDADKCKACKACSRIGCPAITKKDGKAYIDSTLCVGCGVCTQLCAFDAIVGGDAE